MTFLDATNRLHEAGVTMVEVARAFGVTPNTVSRWRSGRGRNALPPPADWAVTVQLIAAKHASRATSNAASLHDLIEAVAPAPYDTPARRST